MDTTTAILAVTGGGDEDPATRQSTSLGRPGAVATTALWFFMGVATMLFTMLSLAYVLRLDGVDGYPLAQSVQLQVDDVAKRHSRAVEQFPDLHERKPQRPERPNLVEPRDVVPRVEPVPRRRAQRRRKQSGLVVVVECPDGQTGEPGKLADLQRPISIT